MKKKKFFLVLIVLLALPFSCKKEKSSTEANVKTSDGLALGNVTYSVSEDSSSVYWVAYKTTDKVPVKGSFQRIQLKNNLEASSPMAAINGVEFYVPVSSVFTDNDIRDSKLKEFFFGLMDQTEFIKGKFDVNQEKSSVIITMNGQTKEIPIDLNYQDGRSSFTATLNLNEWNLAAALKSINDACYELHMGVDGVSKTWDEVEIEAFISYTIR